MKSEDELVEEYNKVERDLGVISRLTNEVFRAERQRDAAIQDASNRLVRKKRFDMPGFRPNRFYISEMQHFGVLPRELPSG